VSPQHVVTGNPNIGLSCPSGMGAGVVCNLASFAASEDVEGDLDDERPVKLR
jgi:hypothetical protein